MLCKIYIWVLFQEIALETETQNLLMVSFIVGNCFKFAKGLNDS